MKHTKKTLGRGLDSLLDAGRHEWFSYCDLRLLSHDFARNYAIIRYLRFCSIIAQGAK